MIILLLVANQIANNVTFFIFTIFEAILCISACALMIYRGIQFSRIQKIYLSEFVSVEDFPEAKEDLMQKVIDEQAQNLLYERNYRQSLEPVMRDLINRNSS